MPEHPMVGNIVPPPSDAEPAARAYVLASGLCCSPRAPAMATYVSELEAAKKSLSEALGENVKQYWANLKLWFKQKISKEEFDVEARRLLTQENVHSHNDFLLAILTRCQILISSPEGAGALNSAAKPGKPKGKKKISSARQKFDHRFQPQNPLAGAQQFISRDPQEEEELKLCSHTMTLPSRGQMEGRMIVTAYEHGLDNVTEEAVTIVIHALEKHLKDLLTSVVSRRQAYRLKDRHFRYAFGCNINPQPYLRNSVATYNQLLECQPSSASTGSQNPGTTVHPDDAEQQAALLLACSGDNLPPSLPPVNMYDLLEVLKIHREIIPSHTVYALNIERVLMKLWHPNEEELQQDRIHRQRLSAKSGLLC